MVPISLSYTTPQAVLGMLPAFLRGGSSAALDLIFPPLSDAETLQVRTAMKQVAKS
jgi:hypothetical protein